MRLTRRVDLPDVEGARGGVGCGSSAACRSANGWCFSGHPGGRDDALRWEIKLSRLPKSDGDRLPFCILRRAEAGRAALLRAEALGHTAVRHRIRDQRR
jgi:hypothetical protein